MATDLLSYQGNADLGLGTNPNIAPNTNQNLDVINNTLQTLKSNDYNQNLNLFNQKISDRDTLRQMLAKGVVASGEIDDQDRPVYDDAEKQTIDAFHNIKNLGDQKGIEDFYKKSNNLNNVVDHAQERNLMLKQLQSDKSNATLPTDQKNIEDFIGSQRKKDFYQRIDPYQKLFSFNTDPINNLYATTASSYDSADKLWHFDDTLGDYAATYKNAQDAYLTNGETAEDMRQLYNKFTTMDKTQLSKSVDAIDKQIELYNSQTGQNVAPVKVAKAADGTILAVQEPVQDFAAKYALANQSDYLTRSQKFNDKYGSFEVASQKADTDALYKKLMANAAQTKAGAYAANIHQQMKFRKAGQEQDDFLNEMYTRNLLQQPSLIKGGKGDSVGLADIQANSSLPLFTLDGGTVKQLKPIGAEPILSPDRSGKIIGYKGGHYEQQYMLNGKTLNPADLTDFYNKFKSVSGSNWRKGYDDFLKEAIANNRFRVILKGENGATDQDVSRAAQLIISNKNTKKGQEAIFDAPPADEQGVSENP